MLDPPLLVAKKMFNAERLWARAKWERSPERELEIN